jgi:hypothetical protein
MSRFFVFGPAHCCPWPGKIGQSGIEHFDLEPERATTGEYKFNHATRVFAAVRPVLDRQKRHHSFGCTAFQP